MLTIDDRIAIQDLLASYCFTLDDRDWTAFSALFHPDAEIDFSAFGGPTGSVETLTQFLKPIAEQVPRWQHTTSTMQLVQHGEAVHARTAAQVMMVTARPDGAEHVSFNGLWYRDELVRHEGRWVFFRRRQQFAWVHNTPG